jgi:hypothetical protein
MSRVAVVTGASRGVGRVNSAWGGYERSGEIVIAAEAALRYGFTDIDGRQPQPLRIENL